MNMQIPARVAARQLERTLECGLATMARDNALLDRTPDDWPEDAGFYPPRATRRIGAPRHAPTGIVTERQNRSATDRQARARRIKQARRAGVSA